jgi:CO/xanthine dehydrogenase FAD-binding subunit
VPLYRLRLNLQSRRFVVGSATLTVELITPRTKADLRRLAGSGRLIGGGTDLLVQIRAGRHEGRLIDLTNLEDAPQPVAVVDSTIEISATAPITSVVEALGGRLPAILAAARLFGSVQIRNRATFGGNLANASPAGDLFPPLIAAEALAVIEGRQGGRVVPVAGLATGPGRTVLAADEWISLIRVPLHAGDEGYIKLAGRAAMAISVVSLAWRWTRQEDGTLTGVRLALGAVAPTVIRMIGAEEVLEGRKPSTDVLEEAARALRSAISPINDVRGSAWYRREVAGDLLKQAFVGEG